MVAMLANTEDVVLVLITIVSKAIFGVICAIIAQSRGRNAPVAGLSAPSMRLSHHSYTSYAATELR